jgi:hypothetical protein
MPLAESWNGKNWVIKPVPAPAGAQTGVLTGVGCTAATACTSVGYASGGSGANGPLAESWDGKTWVIQTTPAPVGATTAALDGVSCLAAAGCTAAGYSLASASMPLAMHN